MAQHPRFAMIAAAISMVATPVAAAELPNSTTRTSATVTPGVFDKDAENAQRHRWYPYHRRNGVDAGDVLAGVLIIGGIAAVASAASKADRDRRDRDYRYRDRDYRDRDYRYRERRGDSRYQVGRGIDNAVNMCVSHIERDVRVETVDSVDRTGEGWRVTGSLYNGERFNCRVGEDGRIDDVDFGGFAARNPVAPAQDKQWSDDRYAAAWDKAERREITPPAEVTDGPTPAYPGGPIDGDVQQDDRYTMAKAAG